MKKPIDAKYLHELEEKARNIGRAVGAALPKGTGFALMLFNFDGSELTWISNALRDDMVKLLDEFRERLMEENADTLSRPKGSG